MPKLYYLLAFVVQRQDRSGPREHKGVPVADFARISPAGLAGPAYGGMLHGSSTNRTDYLLITGQPIYSRQGLNALWTWCNHFTTIARMPTMHKECDWAIRVNGDEPHPLPHVHVGFRDGSRVSVCIETGRVLVGSIRPPARLAPALDWIAAHQEDLFAEYRRLNP